MRGAARFGMITYGAAAGTIDLGNEPPMVVGEDEEDTKLPIPRAVSWRWLSGTVLTGVTSVFLMGAALMAALSNPNQFASLPDSFAARLADDSGLIFGRKGDRVRPVEEHVANRQVLQVSTVTRQGERDFIKLKPFAKINATLSLASPQIAAEVPPYDAVRIFADNSEPDDSATPVPVAAIANASDQVGGGPVDGEVSLKVSDFPVGTPDLEPTVTLDTPGGRADRARRGPHRRRRRLGGRPSLRPQRPGRRARRAGDGERREDRAGEPLQHRQERRRADAGRRLPGEDHLGRQEREPAHALPGQRHHRRRRRRDHRGAFPAYRRQPAQARPEGAHRLCRRSGDRRPRPARCRPGCGAGPRRQRFRR